ncbi:hypothetical protein [Eggerthella sinensis]|uniref:hypothetical protein n=1 Tax=Eggerthella sinensis TaxID=242230 RepID=UPI00266CC137|nr:hypothetical protein [Eggerthella sinensis]
MSLQQERTRQRGMMMAAIVAMTVLLALLLGLAAGCSPQASESADSGDAAKSAQKEDPMTTQAVDWNMQIDCKTCHTHEADTMQDASCPQASQHADLACTQCHTEEATLKQAHEGVTYADKPASKATVVTVDAETCQASACHGTMEDMAAITADSQELVDDKGTVANPHELPSNEQHDANQPTCTDCHKVHTKDLQKAAMKYCAQCHHRGVFECGTCHELRQRAVS